MPSTKLTQHHSDEITIRRAVSGRRLSGLPAGPAQAWGITEESYLIPIATMVGANLHGGLVLGAFSPDGQAVGMSFGFLGRTRGPFLPLFSAHRRGPGLPVARPGIRAEAGTTRVRTVGGNCAHGLGVRPASGGQRAIQP